MLLIAGAAKNGTKAVELYLKSAMKDDTEGILGYARMAMEAQDFSKAVYWLLKGASFLDAACVEELAECYKEGKGTLWMPS